MISLIVNGRDLSAYLRVQHDEGLAPYSEYAEPQFSGSQAFQEGVDWTADAVGNREWTIPLLLSAADRPALHSLISAINADLVRGAQVSFATDGSDPPTYFRLQRGRLDPEYQYFLSAHATLRATLRLWTSPFGMASPAGEGIVLLAASQAAYQIPATGIVGDVDALANVAIKVGSVVATGGRLVGYGVHRSASFLGVRGPSGADFVPQASSGVVGASGAIGSQYLRIPISPTGASGVALTSYLTPPGGHVGRHRVLAVARSGLNAPVTMYARDRWGAPLGPTALATSIDASSWHVVDLGQVNVPARASGQEAVPTQYVEIVAGGASGVAPNATGLDVNRIVYLPLDIAPGILRTKGRDDALIAFDTFTRMNGGKRLDQNFTAELPAWWVRHTGYLSNEVERKNIVFVGPNGLIKDGIVHPGYNALDGALAPNASAHFSLVGQNADTYPDVRYTAAFAYALSDNLQASMVAGTTFVELIPKHIGGAYGGVALLTGLGARLYITPSQTLNILAYPTWTLSSVVASNSIASLRASGLYNDGGGGAAKTHYLSIEVQGGAVTARVGTAPFESIGAALTASHSDFTRKGYPGVRAQSASQAASHGMPYFDGIAGYALGAGGSDMGPAQTFNFDSYPERRVYQNTASGEFAAEQTANFRGDAPRLPAVGSPGASGPGQFLVLHGDPTNFVGNDVGILAITKVERFRFLK